GTNIATVLKQEPPDEYLRRAKSFRRGPREHQPLSRPYLLRSRVRLFVHEAKRRIRTFSVSCRSAMNFVRESLFAGAMRNSGSVWRSPFATTNSEGGMPGRMVRSQDPKVSQTSLGAATARYWSKPWATRRPG